MRKSWKIQRTESSVATSKGMLNAVSLTTQWLLLAKFLQGHRFALASAVAVAVLQLAVSFHTSPPSATLRFSHTETDKTVEPFGRS